jgi:hypothetical protein
MTNTSVGNLPQYNRQSYSFRQTALTPSIGDSLLPQAYAKEPIFIQYQPANQRSQQHH